MTTNKDLRDMIVIVIVLNSVYQDFDTTSINLFETGDRTIDQI